ncbi:hypothetical protein [Azoarcus sp. KH32C]|uniref:glycoside hydrolase family 24 protein n=1 Tax=Azoarcus sp. KH32C TaxID=748247 RepID=UPI00023861CC|nr:hypothetical protein [Azoarcus sp. KH32C]BAL26774.1 hypothetical protein AZKH_4501 [Azoarcus sp. KH32C]
MNEVENITVPNDVRPTEPLLPQGDMPASADSAAQDDIAASDEAPQLHIGFMAFDGNSIPKLGVHIGWPGGEMLCRTDANGCLPPVQAPVGAELTISVERFNRSYKEIGKCLMPASDGVLTACSPNMVFDSRAEKHDGKPGDAKSRVPTGQSSDYGDLQPVDGTAPVSQQEPNVQGTPTSPPPLPRSAPKELEGQEWVGTKIAQIRPLSPQARQVTVKPPQNISGKAAAKQELSEGRDENGNPLAIVTQKAIDWWNSWRLPSLNLWGGSNASTHGGTQPSTPVVVDSEMTAKVKALLDFAEMQSSFKYKTNESSAALLALMSAGKFTHTTDEKKSSIPLGLCYKYVKVALSRCKVTDGILAGKKLIPTQSDADFLDMQESARRAGPALIAKGFSDVTIEVPDPRWAAAGDVIIYEWTDSAWEQRKKKKNQPNLPNFGHIDIRHYETYISDHMPPMFHPRWSDYQNIRIYRKVFDPLPTQRIRAFLRCLREFECQEEHNDEKRYLMTAYPLPHSGRRMFSGYARHPWATVPNNMHPKSTAAGAYQILHSTWREIVDNKLIESESFTPEVQDRIAVMKLEDRHVLHLIRAGKIREALEVKTPRDKLSLPSEWTSLPGGTENAVRRTQNGKPMDLAYLMDLFNFYVEEEKRKA